MLKADQWEERWMREWGGRAKVSLSIAAKTRDGMLLVLTLCWSLEPLSGSIPLRASV